jgi:outer membrane protein OmpA-like peptidoglycan-associated protein
MKYFSLIIVLSIYSNSILYAQDSPLHPAKLFVDSIGQVYTRVDAPAYFFIAPADAQDKLMLVPSSDKGANPMKWDGSGSHYLVHKDLERNMNIRFRILADGQAPRTSFFIDNGLIFHLNNVYFVESGARVNTKARDDMSGVEETYISINNQDYIPIGSAPQFANEGEFLVRVYSVDNVGNAETPNEYRVNTTTETTVRMDNIYFDTNSSSLKPQAIEELNKLVTILKQYTNVHLEIRAHTDSWGDARYNLLLSERRAQAAINYLTSKGIPTERLRAKGFGDTMLVNECAKGVSCPDSKHKENRRVEFVVTKVEDKTHN